MCLYAAIMPKSLSINLLKEPEFSFMEVKDLWDNFSWQQEQVSWCCWSLFFFFFFTKTALMTGSKTRCLWTSGMMQSQEFGTVDGLTRHSSEGGFSRQNWDIYINAGWEATDVSKRSPLFFKLLLREEILFELRSQALKTILCTPHGAQVKFIQTISAASGWITLSFPFFPLTGLFLVINSQSVGKPHCTIS